jgi:acetyltransferase-like isoleucine patch superfamily enzyme
MIVKSIKLFLRRKVLKRILLRERFEVGRGTYGEPKVNHWGENATLRVGSFCSIANGVTIFLGGNHRVDWITTYPFSTLWDSAKGISGHPHTKGDVVIGNDVWIGANATILSGITIGNGAVIGACALVTKSVAPYTIVAGNPAKVIRKRFSEEEILLLEKLAWWDWPEEKLNKSMQILLSGDIQSLVVFDEKYSMDFS